MIAELFAGLASVTGTIVTTDKVLKLADALQTIKQNRELREELKRRCREAPQDPIVTLDDATIWLVEAPSVEPGFWFCRSRKEAEAMVDSIALARLSPQRYAALRDMTLQEGAIPLWQFAHHPDLHREHVRASGRLLRA